MASVVEMFRMPAGSTGALVGLTYATLAKSIVDLAYKHFGPLIADYSAREKALILANGTKVYLVSAEHIQNIRGSNLDWFGLDEGCFVKEEVWRTLIGRMRASKIARAWITSTPQGIVNWVYEQFVLAHADDPNYFLVHAKSDDNPFIPRENIESLRRDYASSYASQELDGLFVDLNNVRVSRSWFKYGLPPADKRLPITFGVDLASSLKSTADYTAICASCYDPEPGFRYVIDVKRDRLTFNGAQQLIKDWAERFNNDDRFAGVSQINVEKVGYQAGAIQELLRTTSLPIKPYLPKGDKLQRFLPVEGQLENGYVYFAPGLDRAFEDELLSFPNSKNDDQIDALVMSLAIEEKRKIRVY